MVTPVRPVRLEAAEILPVMGLADGVLLPGMEMTVVLATVASYGAVREAARSFGPPVVGVFSALGCAGEQAPDGLARVGAVARVSALRREAGGRWVAQLAAFARARRDDLLRATPFRLAAVETLPEEVGDPRAAAALAAALQQAIARAARARPEGALARASAWLAGAELSDYPAIVLPALAGACCPRDWQRVLDADALDERLALVLARVRDGAD